MFDFSFSTFITTSIIRVLYVIVIIGAALGALGVLVGAASMGSGGIILGLFAAPIFFAIAVLFGRLWMETLIVVFRIAENTAEIARASRTPR